MGVHVFLDIQPNRIGAAQWEAAFDETLALLSAWRPALLGLGTREVEGVMVRQYTRSLESNRSGKRSWQVVGDRESLRVAESFELFRDLEEYQRSRGFCEATTTESGESLAEDGEDIVLDRAQRVIASRARDDEDSARTNRHPSVRTLGNKTQGEPYHYAILAAAMLIEERFPRAALVSGDIDRAQANRARSLAAPILGREVALPVCVDASTLVQRLSAAYEGEALAVAFRDIYRDAEGSTLEAMLRALPGDAGANEWRRSLNEADPNTVGATQIVVAWLNADRPLSQACHIACLDADGPRMDPGVFVKLLASTWIGVSEASRRSYDALRRPEGTAPTVWSQLAQAFFVGRSGRDLRVGLDRETAGSILAEVFGRERGQHLDDLFGQANSNIEAQLKEEAGLFDELQAVADEQFEDDTALLATLADPEEMGPIQRSWVETVAFAVHRLLTKLEDQRPYEFAKLLNLTNVRKGIARVARSTYTEDAWDRIEVEEDRLEALIFCFGLNALQDNQLNVYETRRALFENPALLSYAWPLTRDPAWLNKFARQLTGEEASSQADSW